MLTNIAIKSFLPEGGGGLFIHVQPNGAKPWRFAYRFDGRRKLLSGGRYPQLSLLAARAGRDEKKQQLALGLDPSEERRQGRAVAEAQQSGRVRNTFEQVAREWLEISLPSWSPRYAALVDARLEIDIFPVVGSLDIARITPRQVLDAIRKIQARGAVEMARRVKNHCSEIFRYAIPDCRCETDPCRDLSPAMSKPRPVAHRAKVQARDLPGFFAKLPYSSGSGRHCAPPACHPHHALEQGRLSPAGRQPRPRSAGS